MGTEFAAHFSYAQIFELHGRGLLPEIGTSGARSGLAEGSGIIIATGGGIVTHRENFALLKRNAKTIWLRAILEGHWDRVVAQGDHRSMANDPLAKTHLHELLASREDLYRTADHIVETSGAPVGEIVERIVLLSVLPSWKTFELEHEDS